MRDLPLDSLENSRRQKGKEEQLSEDESVMLTENREGKPTHFLLPFSAVRWINFQQKTKGRESE